MTFQKNVTINTRSSLMEQILLFMRHANLISSPQNEDQNLNAALNHPLPYHLSRALELLSHTSLLTGSLKQENFNSIIRHPNLEQINTALEFVLAENAPGTNSEQERFDCLINHDNLAEVVRTLAKKNTLSISNRVVYTRLLLGARCPDQAIQALATLDRNGLTDSAWLSKIINVLLSHSYPIDFMNAFLILLHGKLLDSTSAEIYFHSIASHDKPSLIAEAIRILDGFGFLASPEIHRLLTRHPNITELLHALHDFKVIHYLSQPSGQDYIEMILKHYSPILVVAIIEQLDAALLTNYQAEANKKAITQFKNPVLLQQMLVDLKNEHLSNTPDCIQACFEVLTQHEYPREMIELLSYLNVNGLLQSLASINIRVLARNVNPWIAIQAFNVLLQLGLIPDREKQRYFDIVVKAQDPDFILNLVMLMKDSGLLSNRRGKENFDAIINCQKTDEVAEALWKLRLSSITQEHFDNLLIDENPIGYALAHLESTQAMIVPLSFSSFALPLNLQIIDDIFWDGVLHNDTSDESDREVEQDTFNEDKDLINDLLGESAQSPLFTEITEVHNRLVVLKHKNVTALAYAIDFLYQNDLLNQDNFNKLSKHKQIDALVNGLSSLSNTSLMSTDWGQQLFEQVATHESPWHAAVALWEFSQFGLLTGTHVADHIHIIGELSSTSLRLFNDAIELLFEASILNDVYLQPLVTSTNRYDVAQALVIMNVHGLLTGYAAKANIKTVISSPSPKEMASAMSILHQSDLLKGTYAQIFRHLLSEHKSPYDLAIALCTLEQYDLLTIENIEIVYSHADSVTAAKTLVSVYPLSAATAKSDRILKKAISTHRNPAVITEALLILSDKGLSAGFSASLHQGAVLNHPDPVNLAKALVALMQFKPLNDMNKWHYLNIISIHANPLLAATVLLLPCLTGHEAQKHRHLKQISEQSNTLGVQTILNALAHSHVLTAEFMDHYFGLLLECKHTDHLAKMISMLDKIQLFSAENGRKNIVTLFQHENPLLLLQALETLNESGLLTTEHAEEILNSRHPQLLSQGLTDMHKAGLLNEHNRTILIKHRQPFDASRVFILLDKFDLLSLKIASSFDEAIVGHSALDTVADNLAEFDAEKCNTNPELNDRYSLIINLKNYIARTESSQEGATGVIDFKQGFLFFSKSRGANRQANYLLAGHLLKTLLFSPETPLEELYENIPLFRATLISEHKIQHHSDRAIHSSGLNAIIEKLRSLSTREVTELNPPQTISTP